MELTIKSHWESSLRGIQIQQILGSCSPASMVTTRSPPTTECIVTMPGWSSTTSPMMAAFRPSGWPRITCQQSFGVVWRRDRDQFPLIGDVERIEPQHLAGAAHFGPKRNRRLVQLDTHPRGRRQLVQCAR